MDTTFDVSGLTVVIVGGTGGMGYAAARALVSRGANVVVIGRTQEEVDVTVQALGGGICGYAGDARESATAEGAIALAVQQFGQLDALFHVAGGSGRSKGDGPVHEMTDEGLRYTLDLNLASVILTNRAAVRQFLSQGGGGCILNMGSVLGWSPSPEFFASHAYAAAKAGIVGFSRSIASYYAPQNIRVNVVAPALVDTPMARRAVENKEIVHFVRAKQPLDGGRVAGVDDLEGAVLFLLSKASRFITGQVLAVDGGWTVSEGRDATPPS